MRSLEKQRHMVDKMFLIILFATFAICAFALIMISANVYSHTAITMNTDYEKRIDISYITEKIRQWDEKGSLTVGTFHDKQALVHKESIGGKQYLTYIYQEKDALRELMVREGLDTKTMQGEKIVSAKGFQVKENGQMYDLQILAMNGTKYHACVYRHSRN